jgi:DNA-binding protein WhiA
MSFSNEVKDELVALQLKKNCCKKAFLFGLLINSTRNKNKNFEIVSLDEKISDMICELLQSLYKIKAEKEILLKPGKKYYKLTFNSNQLADRFELLESDPESLISDVVILNCTMCEQSFLRGVFISTATITDPQKSFHLEFAFSSNNVSVASKLYRFLSLLGFVAKITNRQNSTGLYFKSNSTISDLLYFIGAVKLSFDYADIGIEKELRNNENRATNCVARNIYKSVSAAQKHISAINLLISTNKLYSLPIELQQTALLRLENEEVTLTELAALHNPPISKSGLNHRLEKICREAEIIEAE